MERTEDPKQDQSDLKASIRLRPVAARGGSQKKQKCKMHSEFTQKLFNMWYVERGGET